MKLLQITALTLCLYAPLAHTNDILTSTVRTAAATGFFITSGIMLTTTLMPDLFNIKPLDVTRCRKAAAGIALIGASISTESPVSTNGMLTGLDLVMDALREKNH